MRLEITGHLDAEAEFADTVLDDALTLWVNKIAKDNPDMRGMLEKVEAVDVTSLTAEMRFKLEDIEDWQQITTDNHEGIPELLTVKVETDEHGNLLADTVSDNDGNSDFNDFDALIARGLPTEQKAVESKYSSDDLLHKEHVILSDSHWVDISVDAADNVVVQAWHCDMEGAMSQTLIAEVAFPPESLDEVLSHYNELAVSVA